MQATRQARYLTDTGVDPANGLPALEIPPDRLDYFSPEGLVSLRLATNLNK